MNNCCTPLFSIWIQLLFPPLSRGNHSSRASSSVIPNISSCDEASHPRIKQIRLQPKPSGAQKSVNAHKMVNDGKLFVSESLHISHLLIRSNLSYQRENSVGEFNFFTLNF